ncbi:DUF2157 domain-containing protein [Ferruginibacter sp.]|uniref:DUF2157 domain-containing protein n=1 Tax=Ferruginibacter sp. TaxID=1940288 RepID=UPI0019863B71|nr:DUF2157 domain-containing protein [Ferruginibacter sp.]MBC7626499.1 DUF2157 domain-containing protein [Ferruginibacter sp.]
MDITLFNKLNAAGIISDGSLTKIKTASGKPLFSLHWELKTILYLGVLFLSSGIGILIYKNMDRIGHQAVLIFIALVCAGSFYYCLKKKLPFSVQKTASPNVFFDYILLLACLTFISFTGYIQFQYQVFGSRFGLATFIPMIVLFFSAYYFDNLAILSIAIISFATWAGIVVTPAKILQQNDFKSIPVIATGLAIAIILLLAALITKKRNLKAHFEFTYTNFGIHLLFISCLAAMFNFSAWHLVWFLLLIAISYFFYQKAVKERSFYFLLLLSLYGYIGLSYVVIRLLFYTANLDIGGVYLACMYFIASAIGLIFFLIKMNKKIKTL